MNQTVEACQACGVRLLKNELVYCVHCVRSTTARRASLRTARDADNPCRDMLAVLQQIWNAPQVGGSIGERHIAVSDELWERIRRALDHKDCP